MIYQSIDVDVDVVLFEGDGDIGRALDSPEPLIQQRVAIGPGLYVSRLEHEVSRETIAACFPRGRRWDIATNTMPTFYGFVRETPKPFQWDHDQVLQQAVALSRLCHPTSIGLEYAAQVRPLPSGAWQIIPGLIAGFGNQAFVADVSRRNWLTAHDVKDLPAMLSALKNPALPKRLERALWAYEYAARTEHVPVRWTLTATAIEALTHVERFRSTHQFVRGATGLAAMCGIGFSEADAKDAYHERSSYAHGATVGPASPPLLVLMENLVRAALRKGLLDPAFASTFDSDASVRASFPL